MSRPPTGGAPRPRGTGRPRRDRRAIRRGGEGIGGELNRVLERWAAVRITPMFGRWGYFAEGRLFGCFPLQPKAHDLWVRLSARDQARALREPWARPHRRFAARGWIECELVDPFELPRALKWLRRGYEHVRRLDDRE